MSSEPEAGPDGRRTFTDVASLFQPIIPPPGTPVREAPPDPPLLPVAPLSTEPRAQKPLPAPSAPPPAAAAAAAKAPREPFPEAQASREAAFGDAWDAKPNWRPRRSWTWVLLVPLGLLGAALMLTADPAQFRHWFNEHVWAPPPVPLPPLLASGPPTSATPEAHAPAAAEPAPPAPAPAPAEAPAPPDTPTASVAAEGSSTPATVTPATVPAASEPPPTAQPAEAPAPAPAAADTQPAPPRTPEPAASALAPAAPTFGPVAIRYRKSQPGSDADAARLASQLQPLAERVELRATTGGGYRTPTILFFRPEDRAAAISLAQVVTPAGGPWTIRQGQTRQKPGTLEVWLP